MDINFLRQYAELGLHLHPLKPGAKTPLLKNWQASGTADILTLIEWNAKYEDSNWGAVAGPLSGITVIDIDPRNGGDSTWAPLVAKYGEPLAPRVQTPSGGTHYYFQHFPVADTLGRGIDILANKNNVVLPPSAVNGVLYVWENGMPKSFPVAPAWLQKALRPNKGERNDKAYLMACTMFRNGHSTEETMEAVLTQFGDAEEPGHDAGLRKTVNSARQSISAPRDSYARYNGNDPTDFDDYMGSDAGNAKLFAKHLSDDITHIKDFGWAVYADGYWRVDDNLVVQRFSAMMELQMWHYRGAADQSTDMPTTKVLRERERHFTESTNMRRIKNGVEYAQSMAQFATTLDKFDTVDTAHLLNFTNGTVDLRTGHLHPHSREDYITKMCQYPFEPDTEAPFWQRTLNLLFGGDQELIHYVQVMLGASLVGSQDVRSVFIAYGPAGSNGKSALFEALGEVLGGYADHAEFEVLAGIDTGNLTELTTKMRIRGARMVFSSEVSSSDRIDGSAMKRLTGSDSITARDMFKGAVTFRPIFNIWVRTNRLPQISKADAAVWERIVIIPFDHVFSTGDKLDISIVMQKYKDEAPGILAWLVTGAVMWHNRTADIPVPARVQELKTMYMNDLDNFGDFLAEALVDRRGSDSKVFLNDLHRFYVDFCRRRNAKAPQFGAFKQEMRIRGYTFMEDKYLSGYSINQDMGVFAI